MFNCKEVTRLVSESLDHKLPFFQKVGVRIHLLMCKLCPEAKKQMLFIRSAIRSLTLENSSLESEGSLSQEASDRMKLALRKE